MTTSFRLAVLALAAWAAVGSAAPVPKPTAAERWKPLEQAWADLIPVGGREQEAARAREVLAASPDRVPFLRAVLKPVSADEAAARRRLADLSDADERVWKAAYAELAYHDPRLALSVPDVWATAGADGQRRAFSLMTCIFDPDQADAAFAEFAGLDLRVGGNGQAFAFLTPAGGGNQQILGLPKKPTAPHLRTWERAVVAVGMLEADPSPAAVAVLAGLAAGHPDAAPTLAAKKALDRLKAK